MSVHVHAQPADKPIRAVRTSQPLVALTFDDGPDPVNVPRLLSLFEAEQVKATFFVIGTNVRKHPEITRHAFEAGHEIGNHSMTHAKLPECASVEEVRREIADTQAVIKEVVGVEPALFRAPYLAHDQKVWTVLHELNLPSMSASDSINDWDPQTTVEQIIERATAETKAGDILLMHSWRDQTLQAMPEIIKRLKAKGLRMVTVSQLLAAEEK